MQHRKLSEGAIELVRSVLLLIPIVNWLGIAAIAVTLEHTMFELRETGSWVATLLVFAVACFFWRLAVALVEEWVASFVPQSGLPPWLAEK